VKGIWLKYLRKIRPDEPSRLLSRELFRMNQLGMWMLNLSCGGVIMNNSINFHAIQESILFDGTQVPPLSPARQTVRKCAKHLQG
jgi:hypothetical protein